ncbi:MAG: beta-ketoacyl synthase N-terminal-like domain-containing protein [Myxococcota bacterium]
MQPHRRVFVTGGAHSNYIGRGHPDFIWRGHPDHGSRTNPTLEDHLNTALKGMFQSTGVEPERIDRAIVGNFLGACFVRQGHLGAMLSRVCPRLEGVPAWRVEAACASGSIALISAIDAIQAGADLVLVAGVEVETGVKTMDGVDYMARAAHYATERERSPFLFPYLFAERAKAYKDAWGATHTDLARVSLKAITNANRNPNAQLRHLHVTLDEVSAISKQNNLFLEDPELRPHMRFYDATTFTDGASALLLASDRGLAALSRTEADCTELIAYGHRVAPLGGPIDPIRLTTTRAAAAQAFADADLTIDAIDVAEVHDCYSINELLILEAIGLAAEGQGFQLTADGATALEGSLPVNTGGGLLGFGHPVGATGVKQTLEIFRQMKGLCGDYQMATPPRHGMAVNMGGNDRTAVVMMQRNCT